jgi:hypothetical protein
MNEREWLAQPFEENRAVAYRMLGSPSDADDTSAAPRAHAVLRDRVASLDSSC